MKRLVRLAIENTPAMNMLMIAVLVLGTLSLAMMRREVFPRFELEIVLVTVPYPGASPAEVELEVTDRIEKAIQELPELKHLYSISRPGLSIIKVDIKEEYWSDTLPRVWLDPKQAIAVNEHRIDGLRGFRVLDVRVP